jgi:hypothetical protein
MGRLVRLPKQATDADVQFAGMMESVLPLGGIATPAVQTGDNFLERIAKYVPAEVLAFFIFINAILDQAVKAAGPGATMAGFPVMYVALLALVAGIALTPLFVWYVREEGDAWIINASVSTIAFPFWAYAIGAIAFADYRDGNLAAILLATFTVVSGFVRPPMPKARQVARQAGKDGPRLVEKNSAVDDIRAIPINR